MTPEFTMGRSARNAPVPAFPSPSNFDDLPVPTVMTVSPLSARTVSELVALSGPQVETRRLMLRPPEIEDFSGYSEMMADPVSVAFSGRGPLSGDEAWTRFLRQSGHWTTFGYGPFSVIERDSGKYIGEVGFSHYNRNLGGHFDWAPEAGWTIVRDAQVQGYATEAVAGAIAWMEHRVGTSRTVCIIHVRNAASLKVAEKMGFRAFRKGLFRGYEALFMERVAVGI